VRRRILRERFARGRLNRRSKRLARSPAVLRGAGGAVEVGLWRARNEFSYVRRASISRETSIGVNLVVVHRCVLVFYTS
jgi:hypothetical protein